jgi:hypothetical protein
MDTADASGVGIGLHWPFESWERILPEHTIAVSLLGRLLHDCHVVTDGDSYRMTQARARGGAAATQLIKREEWRLSVGHQRGPQLGR